jgi:hypothetical protein
MILQGSFSMLDNYPSGKYTIDRFEGELAVLLLRQNENVELVVKKSTLPNEIEKGSILELEIIEGNIRTAKLLKDQTDLIRKQNQQLLQKLTNTNH